MSYLNYFKELNLDKYDVIVIYSDIMKLIYIESVNGKKFDGKGFLSSIKDSIKDYQTLIMPTFNWSFCHGVAFDYKNTPSATGALSNLALKDSDFKRTKHPIYSFAIYGKDRDKLYNNDYISAFSKESVFSYINDNISCQVGIGKNIYTIAHFVEETEFMDKIEHRYFKTFKNFYIDEYGNKSEKEYIMHVRDYDKNVVIDVTPLHNLVIDSNVTKIKKFENIDFYITEVKDLINIIRNDLKNTGGSLYCTYTGQKGLR